MQVMFIDESGHHNLDVKKIDPNYPLFVLCGCIFDEEYYKKEVVKKFNQLKIDFFGSDEIILHYLEMTRPNKTKDKRFLKFDDREFRLKFYKALNKLISELEFTVVACVIKKVEYAKEATELGTEALDPYLVSFDDLVNEMVVHLNSEGKGKIIAERRNDNLDNQLQLSWLNLKINGTAKLKPAEIKDKLEDLQMLSKSSNQVGLQLADLVAISIGRHILNLKRKEVGHEVDFEILKKKLATDLTIFPRSKK